MEHPSFANLMQRHRGSLSQDAFRDALADGGLSVTRQTISHWEQGAACPDLRTINYLSAILALPAWDRAALIDAAGRYEPPARKGTGS
jgi:DNA-binding XRE family transcriptional regulator